MTQQTYEYQVLALARELRDVLEPGAVLRVSVAHDAICPKLRGGACMCEPVVSVGELWPAGDRPARMKA